MLLLLPSLAFALPGSGVQWTVLSNGDPYIECAVDAAGEPWCRSTGLVKLPIDKVAATLEDMPKHQHLFENIARIDVLAPDTMHIVLDYPGFLSDRDYVATYTRSVSGDTRIYSWKPAATQPPPEDGIIRLPKMAGEWRLTPEGAGTRVTYLWHAEIAGSFPDMMLTTARKIAGQQALKDIRKASERAAAGE